MKRTHFLAQLGGEFRKLTSRRRSALGFVVFALLGFLNVWLMRQPLPLKGVRSLLLNNGFPVEGYLGGLTLASFTLVFAVPLVAGLYLALVSGELIAREIEDGTMRMLLSRPVSRRRLFLLKVLVGVGHTAALMIFAGVVCLAIATVFQGGPGRMLVYAPLDGVFGVFAQGEGFLRYAMATLWMAFTYQTVSALALGFSCLPTRPATATVLTLSILYVDFVLSHIPYLSAFKPWFLSYHLASWTGFFRIEIPWFDMASSALVLCGLTATFLGIGYAAFTTRDIKA